MRSDALLVDTGVLLGAADVSDQDHLRCAETLRQHAGPLVAPAPVVPETAWQIEQHLGPMAEAGFLRLITSRRLEVVDLTISDYERCRELIEAYADLRLGFVDASVVATAERLGLSTIATLNRRDFLVVRPAHIEAFTLLPAPS